MKIRSIAVVLSFVPLLMGLVACGGTEVVTSGGYGSPSVSQRAESPMDSIRPAMTTAENITFSSRLGAHSGFLARPLVDGPAPGIVVIHEWWGQNDQVRAETERLASLGYVALAVDLYGKPPVSDPDQARAMKEAVVDADATVIMSAAVSFLENMHETRDRPIGSIGWCFGGRKSLQLAIADPRIRACVVYYGTPITDALTLESIEGSVLGVFGEADGSIPMAEVEAFRDGLSLANVPNKIFTYPGAGHAFANPSGGERYNAEAADDARMKTTEFLFRELGTGLSE